MQVHTGRGKLSRSAGVAAGEGAACRFHCPHRVHMSICCLPPMITHLRAPETRLSPAHRWPPLALLHNGPGPCNLPVVELLQFTEHRGAQKQALPLPGYGNRQGRAWRGREGWRSSKNNDIECTPVSARVGIHHPICPGWSIFCRAQPPAASPDHQWAPMVVEGSHMSDL